MRTPIVSQRFFVMGALFSCTWPLLLACGWCEEVFARSLESLNGSVDFFVAAFLSFLIFYISVSVFQTAFKVARRLKHPLVRFFLANFVLITFCGFHVVCWGSLVHYGSFPSIQGLSALAATNASCLFLHTTPADIWNVMQMLGVLVLLSIFIGFVFTRAQIPEPSRLTAWWAKLTLGVSVCIFVIGIKMKSGPQATMYTLLKDVMSPELSMASDVIELALSSGERPSLPMKRLLSVEEWKAQADTTEHATMDVFVVVIEALRADILERAPLRKEIVPNLDRMWSHSSHYLTMYSVAPDTAYALEAILSGRYAFQGSLRHTNPNPDVQHQILLFDLLNSVGFKTAMFSASDWGATTRLLTRPSIQRYQDSFASRHLKSSQRGAQEGVPGFSSDSGGFRPFDSHSGVTFSSLDEETTKGFISWSTEADSNQPLFGVVYLVSSHFPWIVDDEKHRIVPTESITEGNWRSIFGTARPVDAAFLTKNYYNALHQVDYYFGKIFDAIATRQGNRPYLLVVVGDHGEALAQHGDVAHASSLYEEQVRVPLLMYDSRERSQSSLPVPVSQVDVAPTILDILGLPHYDGFQGAAIRALSKRAPRDIFLTLQAFKTQDALVRWPYKLLVAASGRRRLFNLETDPGEVDDLSGKLPDVDSRMVRTLQDFKSLQRAYYALPAATRNGFVPPQFGDEVFSIPGLPSKQKMRP